MDDGGITVEVAFGIAGKHPGLTTYELYWVLDLSGYSMTLFKDGMACRGKNGDMVYVVCRPHKPMQDFIPEMQLKEIKWMMGE